MRKKFKKAAIFCYSKSKDCIEIIFQSAANNQMRLQEKKVKRFGSYVQLKKYQKHLRIVALRSFVAAVFLFLGILMGPAFFVSEKKAEIFIPNGKGDILISNVSKSQASVIFKTLDSAHKNKPLATVALVEVFGDASLNSLIKKTEVQDYAVTHIISVDGLAEGKLYYIRIWASESRDMGNANTVSAWGGNEPIVVYAIGNMIPTCPVGKRENVEDYNSSLISSATVDDSGQAVEVATPSFDQGDVFLEPVISESEKPEKLNILGVQNENYLHGREKVQTIISWETNLPGNSVLIYRESKDEEEKEIKISDEKTEKHAAVLTTLKPGTVYYFRVKSKGFGGEVAVSSEYSFHTPRPEETMLEVIGGNFKMLVDQIGL